MIECTLLLLIKGDEILLAMKKRGFGSDRWNGVGGKIEPDETIEQALVRECQEEIEVIPTRFDKVAVIDFEFPPGVTDKQTMHVYLCTEWQGEPAETEEMAPKWFKTSEIPYDDMWQDDIVWLPLVLRDKKMHGHFTFDHNETMLAAEFTLVDKVR